MQYTPGILSVLPLFYVGWADSVLSPGEMDKINEQIDQMDYLSISEKNQLKKWTDQRNPPSAVDFKNWLDQLQVYATDLPISKKVSLVEVGLRLAKKSAANKDQIWDAPKVREAIENLEAALGLSHSLSKVTFYQSLQKKEEYTAEEEVHFSVEQMQRILDGSYASLKNKVKRLLLDDFYRVPLSMKEKEPLRELILEQCRSLAQQGLGAYAYPSEYGGSHSPGGSTAIFEALAYGNMSLLVKYGVQFGLFGGALYQLGTKKHHDLYLELTGTMDLPGCFAMTETGHGSNVRDLETTATYNHEDKTITVHSPGLTAGKEYIGNALHSKMAVVFAQLYVAHQNHGIHAILVPLRDENHQTYPGITIEDNGYKMGLNGVDNGRIWFDKVRVPVDNLLDKYGGILPNGTYKSPIEKESKRFFTMLGALVGGRVSVALGANSGAKKALDIAIRYSLKRRQFATLTEDRETLILDYPTQQWRLFTRLAKSYALSFGLEALRKEFETSYGGPDQRQVETLAAGLKAYSSWHATDTIQECREACGGKGYLAENAFADLKADTDIFTTFEGDNHVLLQLVAKSLLTDLKEEFNDGGFRAVARHVLKRVGSSLKTINNSRNPNADHINSMEFLQDSMEYREQKLLFSLSDRMRSFISKKLAPGEIFLRTQTHMIHLAKAFVEHYIFTQFRMQVERLEEGAEKESLLRLVQIFGLHAIYEDKGWYLENDYLNGDKSKAIRKNLNSHIRQLRPEALALVQSFGIPETLREAKIASFDAKTDYA